MADKLPPSSSEDRPQLRPIDELAANDTRVRTRLAQELKWYGEQARNNQRAYRLFKDAQLIAAALVPVVVTLNLSKWVAGALGSLVVVLQGIQQLHQFQDQWLAYRSTWQALYREQHLYEAKVGDYAIVPNPPALLAERMENLIALEHARWASIQETTRRSPPSA